MAESPIILDGAMGTELIRNGVPCELPLWSADANIIHPEIVRTIHQDYINAGSTVITTNTFRSTTWTYKKAGFKEIDAKERAKRSLYSAVESAQNAKTDGVRIAGSITTIEDCYSPENFPGKSVAEESYGKTMEWLDDAGVDLILFETMGNINEIEIGINLSLSYQLPIWLSLIMKDKNHILDGTSLSDVINSIPENSVNCLLINCNTIDIAMATIENLKLSWKGCWGTYPNLGKTDYENDYFDVINDSNFTAGIQAILEHHPNVVGACCGSTPEHIIQIKKQLK